MVATTVRTAGEPPSAHPAHLLVPEPADGFWYSVKCRLLGQPVVRTGACFTSSRPLEHAGLRESGGAQIVVPVSARRLEG